MRLFVMRPKICASECRRELTSSQVLFVRGIACDLEAVGWSAHRVGRRQLEVAFGLFLFIISIRFIASLI
jgi:hypothetical protein